MASSNQNYFKTPYSYSYSGADCKAYAWFDWKNININDLFKVKRTITETEIVEEIHNPSAPESEELIEITYNQIEDLKNFDKIYNYDDILGLFKNFLEKQKEVNEQAGILSIQEFYDLKVGHKNSIQEYLKYFTTNYIFPEGIETSTLEKIEKYFLEERLLKLESGYFPKPVKPDIMEYVKEMLNETAFLIAPVDANGISTYEYMLGKYITLTRDVQFESFINKYFNDDIFRASGTNNIFQQYNFQFVPTDDLKQEFNFEDQTDLFDTDNIEMGSELFFQEEDNYFLFKIKKIGDFGRQLSEDSFKEERILKAAVPDIGGFNGNILTMEINLKDLIYTREYDEVSYSLLLNKNSQIEIVYEDRRIPEKRYLSELLLNEIFNINDFFRNLRLEIITKIYFENENKIEFLNKEDFRNNLDDILFLNEENYNKILNQYKFDLEKYNNESEVNFEKLPPVILEATNYSSEAFLYWILDNEYSYSQYWWMANFFRYFLGTKNSDSMLVENSESFYLFFLGDQKLLDKETFKTLFDNVFLKTEGNVYRNKIHFLNNAETYKAFEEDTNYKISERYAFEDPEYLDLWLELNYSFNNFYTPSSLISTYFNKRYFFDDTFFPDSIEEPLLDLNIKAPLDVSFFDEIKENSNKIKTEEEFLQNYNDIKSLYNYPGYLSYNLDYFLFEEILNIKGTDDDDDVLKNTSLGSWMKKNIIYNFENSSSKNILSEYFQNIKTVEAILLNINSFNQGTGLKTFLEKIRDFKFFLVYEEDSEVKDLKNLINLFSKTTESLKYSLYYNQESYKNPEDFNFNFNFYNIVTGNNLLSESKYYLHKINYNYSNDEVILYKNQVNDPVFFAEEDLYDLTSLEDVQDLKISNLEDLSLVRIFLEYLERIFFHLNEISINENSLDYEILLELLYEYTSLNIIKKEKRNDYKDYFLISEDSGIYTFENFEPNISIKDKINILFEESVIFSHSVNESSFDQLKEMIESALPSSRWRDDNPITKLLDKCIFYNYLNTTNTISANYNRTSGEAKIFYSESNYIPEERIDIILNSFFDTFIGEYSFLKKILDQPFADELRGQIENLPSPIALVPFFRLFASYDTNGEILELSPLVVKRDKLNNLSDKYHKLTDLIGMRSDLEYSLSEYLRLNVKKQKYAVIGTEEKFEGLADDLVVIYDRNMAPNPSSGYVVEGETPYLKEVESVYLKRGSYIQIFDSFFVKGFIKNEIPIPLVTNILNGIYFDTYTYQNQSNLNFYQKIKKPDGISEGNVIYEIIDESISLIDEIIEFSKEYKERLFIRILDSTNQSSLNFINERDYSIYLDKMGNHNLQLSGEDRRYKTITTNRDIEEVDEALKRWAMGLVNLDSLATISLSIHDAKAPVRRLGHVGVSGFTKAIRTIAGTMVFLIVEDHPLRELMGKDPSVILNSNSNQLRNSMNYWSRDSSEDNLGRKSFDEAGEIKIDGAFLSSLLSPFNLMLRYQTEVKLEPGKGKASMIIEGIEITGESIVTSVNDMVTEVVVQFVAKDVYQFSGSGAKEEIVKAFSHRKVES